MKNDLATLVGFLRSEEDLIEKFGRKSEDRWFRATGKSSRSLQPYGGDTRIESYALGENSDGLDGRGNAYCRGQKRGSQWRCLFGCTIGWGRDESPML